MARSTKDIRLLVRAEVESAIRKLKEVEGGLDGVEGKGKGAGKALGGLGAGIAGLVAGLSVAALGRISLELSKISAEATNVSSSFFAMEGSALLIRDVDDALKGTVDTIELMKQLNLADDLGATNDQLVTFAKFARLQTLRRGGSNAQRFGEIISGVLRGSTELLDNFGISLTELNKETENLASSQGKLPTQLSAVERRALSVEAAVNLMNRRLAETGEIQETQADKIARAEAQIKNFTTLLSISLTNALGGAVDLVDVLLKKLGFDLNEVLATATNKAFIVASNNVKEFTEKLAGVNEGLID